MFKQKNKITEERIKHLIDTGIQTEIQKVKQEFIYHIYALNQKIQEQDYVINQLRNEQFQRIQQHIEEIDAKIWSFVKVWNPVMQSNLDRIKSEIKTDIDEKLEKAVQKILDTEMNINKYKNSDENVRKEIDKRISKLSYTYQEKIVEMDEKMLLLMNALKVNITPVKYDVIEYKSSLL